MGRRYISAPFCSRFVSHCNSRLFTSYELRPLHSSQPHEPALKQHEEIKGPRRSRLDLVQCAIRASLFPEPLRSTLLSGRGAKR